MNNTREKIQNLILFLTDGVCLVIAYYLTGYLWLSLHSGFAREHIFLVLNDKILVLAVAFLVSELYYLRNEQFITRGAFVEFRTVVKENIMVAVFIAVIELLNRESTDFPRGLYVFMIVASIAFMFLIRIIVKAYLKNHVGSSNNISRSIMVSTEVMAEELLEERDEKANWLSKIVGMAIINKNMVGESIHGVPVVANEKSLVDYVKREVIDEVFINIRYQDGQLLTDMVDQLEDMGVTVHIRVNIMDNFKDYDAHFGYFEKVPVVTFANRFYDMKAIAVKRCMDIVGSIVGMLLMAVVMIFVAPAIKLESPGPLFFKQKRVGKNGRYFYAYKFRSMYIDAEERKKELMSKNEMGGLMFKMKDDPRITKVGKFIRKTSIDELPQFINVFFGDMSLVGTRPPTVDEFKRYKGHHKRRLSMKPGITGMWQAYGRQTVTEFDEVVAMDLDYIDNWSLALDIKILGKTVISVFQGSGQ